MKNGQETDHDHTSYFRLCHITRGRGVIVSGTEMEEGSISKLAMCISTATIIMFAVMLHSVEI